MNTHSLEIPDIVSSAPHYHAEATLTHEIQRLAKIGSWERDLESGIITWSEEARYIVNVPDTITIDEYIERYVHPDDRDRLTRTIHTGLAEGTGYEAEYRIILEHGLQKTVRVSTILPSDVEECGKCIRGFIQDISSWKSTQDELAEQRFLLKESQQIAKIGGWEYDIVQQKLTWTDEYYDIIKRSRKEYPATIENYYALVHNSDRQRVYDDMQQALRGRTDALEYRIIMPDDTVKYIRGYGNTLKDASGKIVKLRGVIQDISDTKRTERKLLRLTEILNQAQHLTHLGSWELDLRSGELTWSDEFFRQLGYEPQQFTPETGYFIKHVHPDDRHIVLTALEALRKDELDTLPSRFIEYRLLRADGTMRYMRGTGGNILSSSGQVIVVFGTLQDITASKQAQMLVEESEAKFRRLFEQASVGQIMYNAELVPLQANPALLKMLGYTLEEFLRLPYLAALHPDDHHKFHEQLQALWLGNIPSVQADMRFVRSSGVVVWCRIQASVFEYLQHGTAERYILVAAEDITQYRQVEEAIQKTLHREREVFDLRNRMVTRFSHNLQTPLSTIALAVNIMQKHHARMPEEKMSAYLSNIIAGVEEVQSLLSNMVLMGKLETGRAQLSLAPLNVTTFCKRLYSEFTSKYSHRPIDAALQIPDNAASLADHELLRLIIWHLLLFLDKGLARGAAIHCALEGEYNASTQAIQTMRWYFSCEAQQHGDVEALLQQNDGTPEHDLEVGLPTIQQAVRLHGGTISGSNNGQKVRLILTIPAFS